MKRREAIQQAALMLGGVLSAPTLAGAMGRITNIGPSVPVTPAQEALLAEVADVIIPTTTTPGAKAAGVEKFIVRVMRDCYPKADQEAFYGGLAKLEATGKEKFGKEFASLDAAQKIDLVKQTTMADKPFFLRMKELTTTGYFTSEIGATKALEYVPVPGKFEACIPLKPGQKTWAI
ncbi:gluconate 2-dehydrogenase subunit 3 family protein [Fibrivirga algicola]|uniref:Gluconate 2-dehydrogenase subunit 3 family protein n=1 Tax=Fibrivirga algicola TaxID=2950420 RepID=A0ABX0QAC4_9BACT|nr:gluconate 2-dehydrogenase subunit 3 family protein [Fibrivirga algicola]NID09191.1 gluconate 2-dehydrogenase subunit 3 family protein [Fibrivirga algicola]